MAWDHMISTEALTNTPRIVLSGREKLLVECHRGIITYSDERLIVRLAQGYLHLSGENLSIDEYSARDLLVQGKIASLAFDP